MHTMQPDDRSDGSVAHADRLFQEGLSLHREGRLLEARSLYERALEVQRRHFGATHMSGVIAHQLGDAERARDLIGRAIDIDGSVAAAHCNLGNALCDLAEHTAALACYERSISLNPGDPVAHTNRGNLLQDLGQYAAAVASYDGALALKPDDAAAHRGRGVSLDHLRHHTEAILSYDRALALQPGDADAHNARGNAFRSLGDLAAASASYDRAIALEPLRADFQHNRGAVLDDLGDFPKAIECFAEALRLDPGYPYLPGMLLYLKRRICDWQDDAGSLQRLTDAIERHAPVASPFSAAVLIDSPALQLKAAQRWIGDRHPERPDVPGATPCACGPRMRIGYFSADFHDHATAYLMAELFETHDRTRFEVFGFSFGPCRDDAMGRRLRAAFDGFVDVRTMSDQEAALLARKMGIDIALDLKGFTTGNRVDIFAHRAAPVQVNYLGFPGTTGAGYMDYVIADRVLIPDREREYYSEKVVCLPHSYQVNDRRRPISDKIFSREELALPSSGFVFCCFNNNYKINAGTYDGWMRILARVDGSVLWLLEDNALAAANLRKEAHRRGIDPGRLVFAQRVPLADHLARHRAADLFLDTAPYNAHTTARAALWCGLPVLTLGGTTFAGRVTSSLLSALDLPELITATSQGYEALAVRLATHPEALAELGKKLAANRLTQPLFDTPLFTRHLEDAFTHMNERRLLGLEPAHIIVTPGAKPN